MIRSKGLFVAGSIVSMVLTFFSFLCGFIEDAYHYYSGYYYYYSYSSGYSYYTSFAESTGEVYWSLFFFIFIYMVFSIVAMALYNKRVKAINILNLIFTLLTYSFILITVFVAYGERNNVFATILFSSAIVVAFPFHFIVEIFALVAQRYKVERYAQPAYVPQQPAYPQQPYSPQQPVYPQQPNYYQQPVYPQQPVYTQPAPAPANTSAMEKLQQLKALYDSGALTEEEYNAKRQQYINQI